MSASRDAQPPSPGDGGAAVVTPPGGRIRRTVRLAGALSSCSLARRVLREVMGQHGFEACLDAAELACTELVSNVVLHAHTDLELTVEVDRTAVRVEVRDFSPVLPVQRSYDSQATTGRGLALVAVLTTDHGITDAGPGGKTAWFSISPDSLDEQSPADLLQAWADADWDMPDPAPLPQVPGVQVREVSLLALPSALWLAARQHHDALVRELVLHLAEHSDQVAHVDVPATDLARALLSAAVAAAVEKIPTADRSAADAAGAGLAVPWPLDLVLQVPEALGPAFASMQDTLDAAERLALDGRLLARPGLPEIVAVRDWACEQVIAQLNGVEPSPWPGTAQERFTHEVRAPERDRLPTGELEAVRAAPRPVLAADDANRIVAVSLPLAALVGWEPQDLVGRRLVTLIPARYREAHVAGFSRYLSSGQARLLGTPLQLPVLRADGAEVTCEITIRRRGESGQTVFVADVDAHPVPEAAPG